MNVINLYCKANKRKRGGKAVGAYAYLLKEGTDYKEEVHLLEEEIRVARLEMMALSEGLKALEDGKKLESTQQIHIYVSNEYILEELLKGMEDHSKGKALHFNKGTEYVDLWEDVENLLTKCMTYTVTGLNKKDRGEDEEEIKRNIGVLNKIVCDEINQFLR